MRIFLAATKSGMNKELKEKTIEKCKPLYILETFFNKEKACLEAMNIVGNENFLLDSGAFSFMNGTEISKEEMENYIDRYIKFIKDYNIKYFFEVDVDVIFGLEQVEKWTKKIESEVGRQCIPVWHKSRGVEYWKKLCATYKYIAVGGFAINDIKKQEYPLIQKMVEYAYQKGVKVHGLGFTKTKILKSFKFYSVDSSSWTIGASIGQQLYTFKNGDIHIRRLEKEGNKKTDLKKLVAHSMCEWVKYQKFMNGVRW
ncbi:hypothetical protein QMM58_19270 [Clostridioides difficile]|nr:hypothetical protein [Clostridioides difficile]